MTGAAVSLQDLNERIAAREARLAQDRESLVYQLTVVEDFVADAAKDLAKHAREYAEALESRASCVGEAAVGYRSEPSWHSSPFGVTVQAVRISAAETKASLAGAQLGLTEQKLGTAFARLSSLRTQLAESAQTEDHVLSSLREQRDQLLERFRRASAVDQEHLAQVREMSVSVAAQPVQMSPEEEKGALKAVRSPIRNDEWDDLPAFHGTGDLPQRDCLHCGAAVPVGRKRFCAADCHRMHMAAYGSPTMPARQSRS